ncbi:MAG: BBP7 family outer membrane beta-barrel protein [Planctomycetota bacterium]|nr:BBP7 family outer membrane beta-barrel protein [Planctomycetota bacterium]
MGYRTAGALRAALFIVLAAGCFGLGADVAWAQGAGEVMEVVEAPPPADEVRFVRHASSRTVWDVTAEVGLTLIEDPEGILGEPVPGGVTPFDYGVNSYDPAFAARFTVGYRDGRGTRWEGRFAWLGSADDSSRQTGQFGFRTQPGGTLLLSPTATTTLSTETEAWSGEINWWRQWSCDPCALIEYGIGARVIAIDDEVTATNWAGLAPNAFLSAEAQNRFIGAQLMAAYRSQPTGSFSWSASGKVLLGWMNRDLTESDTSIVTGGTTTNGSREETDFTWGFELEVSALWRVMNRIGITASYTLLYLDEVSRVEDVLDFSQAATGSLQMKDASDSALIHAFFVGVRLDI